MILELTPQIQQALDTLAGLHPNESKESLTKYIFILAFYQMLKDFGDINPITLSHLTYIETTYEQSSPF